LSADVSGCEATREEFVRVCTLGELQTAQMLECAIDEHTKVLVLWTQAGVRAYQADCPHQSIPLVEGIFDGEVLTCNEHLWQFDALTGCGLYPEGTALGCYAVRLDEGQIWVGRKPPGQS